MIQDFVSKLKGKYNNWKQASSSPRDYMHVHILWDQIGENELTIRQWYDYEGKDNPYRTRWHKVVPNKTNDTIIVENWDDNWTQHNKQYDMIFSNENGKYKGHIIRDDAIVRGDTIVKSFVSFDGTTYKSMDQGWKKNELVWGSLLVYEFQKEVGI